MNIHEYQGKEIFRKYGVAVPNGKVAFHQMKQLKSQKSLVRNVTVVKAQIHAGGRGKAGGVKIAKNLDEVRSYAKELLGKILVTHQTGPEGKEVKRLYIEEGSDIQKEYYLSFVLDRATSRVTLMGSEEGGMDIEEVAETNPEKIFKEVCRSCNRINSHSKHVVWRLILTYQQNLVGKAVKFMLGFIQSIYR